LIDAEKCKIGGGVNIIEEKGQKAIGGRHFFSGEKKPFRGKGTIEEEKRNGLFILETLGRVA
jgi:hypothetical protein